MNKIFTEGIDDENFELVNNSTTPYFLFLCNNILYAIDADNVLEIIEYQSVTPVPLMQSYIWGVTNVRGNIVPVIDFNDRVSDSQTKIDLKTSFVLIKLQNENEIQTLAIVIDEIFEVDGLDLESVSNTPSFGTPIDPKFIDHLARYNGDDVLILNLNQLFKIDEINQIVQPDNLNPDDFKCEAKQHSYIWDDDDEEDELDIVDLISSNANDTNQYLVFKGPYNEYYAQNVSKIEEILPINELSIKKNFDDNVVIGVADVRGKMLSIIGFNTWMGQSNSEEYKEVIISNYGKHKFGLAVNETELIITINPENMIKSSDGDSRSTFVSKIDLYGEDILCTIIDSDLLTINAFETEKQKIENDILLTYDSIESEKYIYFADDSLLVRNLFIRSVTKMNAKCKIFENGQELLNALQNADINDIGLIITDLEMPILDGRELIKNIKADHKFDDVHIIVYTNMANNVLSEQLFKLGATDVQTKIDFSSLNTLIKKYLN